MINRNLTPYWWDLYRQQYFTIEFVQGTSINIVFGENLSTQEVPYLEYSKDGEPWVRITNIDNQLVSEELTGTVGTKYRWRGDCTRLNTPSENSYLSYGFGWGKFQLSSPPIIKIYGNIMSLFYLDDFKTKTSFKPFNSVPVDTQVGYNGEIFKNFLAAPSNSGVINPVGLSDFSKLVLPAKILPDQCYSKMFELTFNSLSGGITNYSTVAPYLPAENVSSKCYENMFGEAQNLNKIYLGALTAQSDSFNNWVNNLSEAGNIYMKIYSNINLPANSNSGVPSGWKLRYSFY